jgi:hypothetical protein
MAALLNCQISVLLHDNTVLLQSVCFFSQLQVPRGGNGPIDNFNRNGYHRRGGHRAISWCEPVAGNEHRGSNTMGHKSKESCHEEIIAVSADPFCIMTIQFFSTCVII